MGLSNKAHWRTFITRLIEYGADIKTMFHLVGHANITITAAYIETNPNTLKRITSLAVF